MNKQVILAAVILCSSISQGCATKSDHLRIEIPSRGGVGGIPNLPCSHANHPDAGIYRYSPRKGATALILALWKNGEMVWSARPIFGGPPYYSGSVDAAKAEQVLLELAAVAGEHARGLIAIDAAYTVMYGASPTAWDLASVHECRDAMNELVPEEYRESSMTSRCDPAFLSRWNKVRDLLTGLQPSTGREVEVELKSCSAVSAEK